MKCSKCDGKGYYWGRVCFENRQEDCRHCHHGWLPFWTPAERVGLKAMGNRVYSIIEAKKDLTKEELVENKESVKMIRAYVGAVRKIKED